MSAIQSWGRSFTIGKCFRGHDVVKRQEDPLQGEVRRESWWCRCNKDSPMGEMVEFASRGAKRA